MSPAGKVKNCSGLRKVVKTMVADIDGAKVTATTHCVAETMV
jgi:hypothetical protein